MADIELVIKIPENIWEAIQNGDYCGILDDRTYIKNGTLLPKGHGRLIDANALDIPVDICDGFEAMDYIDGADTIIPADNEGE